jgi:hypothetical protein
MLPWVARSLAYGWAYLMQEEAQAHRTIEPNTLTNHMFVAI